MKPIDVLRQSNFGKRVAEEEMSDLAKYFVQTEQWRKVFDGEVDVIYGPKGSGKSALYLLLNENQIKLFDRGVVLIAGEEPRGQPAFRSVEDDPPTSEPEFQNLWKLYFVMLIDSCLEEYKVSNSYASDLRAALIAANLSTPDKSLAHLLKNAIAYVRSYFRKPSSLEGGVDFDPLTGLPKGFKGKITFSEPPIGATEPFISVNRLLSMANNALIEGGISAWIVLDRLDVAFADNPDLEKNALRALFRVYLDMRNLAAITPKVFLRTDIWKRITDEGFREASHVTNTATIRWDRKSLLNMIVNRLLKNPAICSHYNVVPDEIHSSLEKQEAFFYRVFPRQIDVGPSKSEALEWMINRTMDGTKQAAPRELIHLLNQARDNQIQQLELGGEDGGSTLLSNKSIRDALPEVSKTRLEQTLYAEYPRLRTRIESLKGEHTLQREETLARIWNTDSASALAIAGDLVNIGFFEPRGTREAPQFWVPFIYRDAAGMVQGTAASEE